MQAENCVTRIKADESNAELTNTLASLDREAAMSLDGLKILSSSWNCGGSGNDFRREYASERARPSKFCGNWCEAEQ